MKKLKVIKGIECMSCLSCALACSEAFYKVADPAKSCIQIRPKKNDPMSAQPNVCVQCGKCAAACPNDAITQNKLGVYTVNKKLCVGCGECIKACPFHVMVLADDAVEASKCIACGKCVKACPMEMLEIVEA